MYAKEIDARISMRNVELADVLFSTHALSLKQNKVGGKIMNLGCLSMGEREMGHRAPLAATHPFFHQDALKVLLSISSPINISSPTEYFHGPDFVGDSGHLWKARQQRHRTGSRWPVT